ncbi:Lar family restriction alleviation protein [Brucella sp.]|uniref:Lar family restriction alleviation protein n=1 Tax=Brucella sp. TaxID=52132 RepID=UPI0028ABE5E6|nr:Lar family restriction alleviation protein [Brucella sp.]
MASELKPCPFCGSNRIAFRSTPDMDTDGKFHRISCNECGAGSREKFAMETCPLFYEELRSAWNTRPAPAATDTGLETVETQWRCAFISNDKWVSSKQPENMRDGAIETRELVTRSQAEKLLAAEREKVLFLKTAMEIAQTHCGLKDKTIDSLEADNAALIHDLNRIKDHETELVNDNDALTARIKELEKLCNDTEAEALGYASDKAELEAKLAAAQKALEAARPYVEDYDTRRHNTGVDETLTQIDAVLGGKPL